MLDRKNFYHSEEDCTYVYDQNFYGGGGGQGWWIGRGVAVKDA